MIGRSRWHRWCPVLLLGWVPLVSFSQPPRPNVLPSPSSGQLPRPKLEAIAETNLLMEGLVQSNFRGLNRMLGEKPTDVETWTFARGQALLLAESGNLLLLRPPRNQGQEAWMSRSSELRDAASRLARNLAARDYPRSRAGVIEIANVCNRCHQTFRVRSEIIPFAKEVE